MAADSTHAGGTAVARRVSMVRRITAVVAMIAIVGLLMILVWRVYLHHERGVPTDEPAVVSLFFRAA